MAQFATASDFATFIRRDLSASDTASAEQALTMASGVIQSYTRQKLLRVTSEVVILPGSNNAALKLPERPVVSVSAVTIDGYSQLASTYKLANGTLWRSWSGAPYIANGADDPTGYWGGRTANVTVTYTHGYSPIPDDIKAVCMQLAARMMGNQAGFASETAGSYSFTSASGAEGGLTDGEKTTLSKYRRTTA